MLISEQDERGRKFKLAIRAGLPILALISLVAYATLLQTASFNLGLRELTLGAALVFVTTYFIFFSIDEGEQKSLIDPITGSYNYASFLRHYHRSKPNALGLLLINNLGTINENYGISDIDHMLKTLIRHLNQTLTAARLQPAIIGRKQGAEFLIAVRGDERQLADAIGSFVRDHATIGEIELDYRFETLGGYQPQGEKAIYHLHDTIQANLQARVEPPEHFHHHIVPIRETEQRIIDAIKAENVAFMLRPLYHLRKQKIDTYEVAVKIPQPGQEALLPRTYLPIVNRLGLGREYDLLILKHAVALLQLIDPEIAFSFNLSPFSLRSKDFQAKAFDLLTHTQIDPARVIIELYERKTHHNLEGYLKTLGAFRAQGFRICIDNFGSSNASMEYMRHFKFDMVQFDRDFVGKLDDGASRAMLHSLIRMAKELGITSVAKWVDKTTQKAELKAMGVDYIQGFIVAQPLSETELIQQYNPPPKASA